MAALVYATIADLENLGIASEALADIDATRKNAVLASTSRLMDGFFAAQFKLPIIAFGEDVKGVCADISAYRLLKGRGFNPEGIDQSIKDSYDEAMKLLKIWSQNDGAVPDVTDSSPNAKEQTPTARPSMTSSPSRGWSGNGLSNGSSNGIPFTDGRP